MDDPVPFTAANQTFGVKWHTSMTASDMTELLQRSARGDKQAEADLLPRVYREFHRMAKQCLRGERPGHTLQATALVHEVYIRLFAQKDIDWQNRAHFFRIAGQTMRRILVDYARERRAAKRGGSLARVSLDESLAISPEQCTMLSDLDEALDRLAQLDDRQAKVVELRFFGGLTEEEIGEALQVSPRTVKRDWRKARAWLYDELPR